MSDALHFQYKLGTRQVLFKKTATDSSIFFSHMEYGRKIEKVSIQTDVQKTQSVTKTARFLYDSNLTI